MVIVFKGRLIYRRSIAGKTVSAREMELNSFTLLFRNRRDRSKKGKHCDKRIMIAEGSAINAFIALSNKFSDK